MKEVLLFNIKDNYYAIEVKEIKEVINVEREFNSVPNSQPELIGLLLHRGQALPIIDLRLLLTNEKNTYENKKIIVIDHNQDEVGFLIDNVYQVTKVEDDEFMNLPDNFDYIDESVFKFKEKLYHLLSINRLSSVLSEPNSE